MAIIKYDDDFTVLRALHFLHYWFNALEEEIQFCGQHLTLAEFQEKYPGLHNEPAECIYIRFFGGPKGHQNFFNGSLLTLFRDKVRQLNQTRKSQECQLLIE